MPNSPKLRLQIWWWCNVHLRCSKFLNYGSSQELVLMTSNNIAGITVALWSENIFTGLVSSWIILILHLVFILIDYVVKINNFILISNYSWIISNYLTIKIRMQQYETSSSTYCRLCQFTSLEMSYILINSLLKILCSHHCTCQSKL